MRPLAILSLLVFLGCSDEAAEDASPDLGTGDASIDASKDDAQLDAASLDAKPDSRLDGPPLDAMPDSQLDATPDGSSFPDASYDSGITADSLTIHVRDEVGQPMFARWSVAGQVGYLEDTVLIENLPAGDHELTLWGPPEYRSTSRTVTIGPNAANVVIDLTRWTTLPSSVKSADHHVHAIGGTPLPRAEQDLRLRLAINAEGLDYITEANVGTIANEVMMGRTTVNNTTEFMAGTFSGHVLVPGFAGSQTLLEGWPQNTQRMTPSLAFARAVTSQASGAFIYAHPTTPAHQTHWMGGWELLHHGVMGEVGHSVDIDSRLAVLMLASTLATGNTLNVSGGSDAVLNRPDARPGRPRHYITSNPSNYADMLQGLRDGDAFASKGEIFAIKNADGAEVRHLNPVIARSYSDQGVVDVSLSSAGPNQSTWSANNNALFEFLRVQDDSGNWSVTSPRISPQLANRKNDPACALVVGAGNYMRGDNLSGTERWMHISGTVRGTALSLSVTRNGIEVPIADGAANYVPVTGVFWPDPNWYEGQQSVTGTNWQHILADLPIEEGTYVVTITGTNTCTSEPMVFGATVENESISFAVSRSPHHQLRVRGAGGGNSWWYPSNAFYESELTINGTTRSAGYGSVTPWTSHLPTAW